MEYIGYFILAVAGGFALLGIAVIMGLCKASGQSNEDYEDDYM